MHSFSKMVLFFGLVFCITLIGCGGGGEAEKKSQPAGQTKSKGQQWMEKAGSSREKHEGGSKISMERKEIDVLDNIGRSALHRAALNGNLEEVTSLISRGAIVDNLSAIGTPLYYAVDEGHIDIVKLLIEKGADVNQANGIGDLPLDTAYSNLETVFAKEDKEKYTALVEFLKSRGAHRKK